MKSQAEAEYYRMMKEAMNGSAPQRVHPSTESIDKFIHRCITELNYSYVELYNELSLKSRLLGKYQNQMVSSAEIELAPDILSRLRYFINQSNRG